MLGEPLIGGRQGEGMQVAERVFERSEGSSVWSEGGVGAGGSGVCWGIGIVPWASEVWGIPAPLAPLCVPLIP